jgi:hypothetical protein
MKKFLVGGGLALLLIGCGSTATPSDDDNNRLNENANNGVATTSATKAPVVNKTIGGGTWEVGTKDNISAHVISPGTYVITTPEDGYNCYWETVRDFEDGVNSIIANGNVDPGQNALAVVKSSYKGLILKGECLAVKKAVKKK